MMATSNLRACEFAYNFVGSLYECAYCADPADTEDHTVPSWYVASNIRLICAVKFYKVACCRDCNSRAGSKVDRTFLQRKRRIAVSLRRKHKRLLAIADWDAEEVQEMGRTLRDFVILGIKQQEHLLLRLRYLDSPTHPAGMPAMFFSGISKAQYAP